MKGHSPDQWVIGYHPELHHGVVYAFEALIADRVAESISDDCCQG